MNNNKIIGIDLGTTNSCVAIVEGGRPIVIPNSEGYATTPSIVAFSKGNERLVGQAAKKQAITNPERTIRSIKRHMGTQHHFDIDHRSFSPEQISAIILQKMRKQAQDYLGEKVNKAIITVPAYFDDTQRLATRDAGQIAGLEVVRIINEPTASALTYGLHRTHQESSIVVFDFGGGTFDVTVLQLDEQVLHVKATSGNNQLGGDDFDHAIIEWIKGKFKQQHSVDLSYEPMAIQRLKEAAEAAKIELSSCSFTDIQLPFLAYQAGEPLHFQETLTVKQFNEMTASLVQAVADPIKTALADAKLAVEQIDHVLLIGGSTRVPAVQDFIKGFFNKEPSKSVNPDEAVALGAAIQGGILNGEIQEILLLDVIPISIGLELGNGQVNRLFSKNTTIPISTTRTFTTASDHQRSISGHVVQGEEQLANENKSLARFDLIDIPAAPARTAQISVKFTIDVDGIFLCEARDIANNIERPMVLKRTHGLSREKLDRLSQQAASEAETERLAEERTQATVLAQSCLSDAQRTMSQLKETLTDSQQEEIRSAINALRESVASLGTLEINQFRQELEALINTCSQKSRLGS